MSARPEDVIDDWVIMWTDIEGSGARETARDNLLAMLRAAGLVIEHGWQPPSGRDFTADEQGAARRLMGDLP